MTPELRAALRHAVVTSGSESLEGDLDAIEPIIDAAMAEAVEDVIYLDWAPKLRRDALLAAADDLDNHAGQEDLSHLSDITDWLRARANEGTGS